MAESEELAMQTLRELREMRDEMNSRFDGMSSQPDRINDRLEGINKEYEDSRKVLSARWS